MATLGEEVIKGGGVGEQKLFYEFQEYVQYCRAQQQTYQDMQAFDELYQKILQEGFEDRHWIFADRYICRIHRNTWGNWCGYVGVPLPHPLHGVDYNEAMDRYPDLEEVHGGLTYSEYNHEWGGKDNIWFFGFDTGHANDLTIRPIGMYVDKLFSDQLTYKDKDYVIRETNYLARRLYDIERKVKRKGRHRKR